MNIAAKRRIHYTKYSEDIAAAGLPAKAIVKFVGCHSATTNPSGASMTLVEQLTLHKPTTMPVAIRRAVWSDLVAYTRGHPCTMLAGGTRVRLDLGVTDGRRWGFEAGVTTRRLSDGPATFILKPSAPVDFACKPLSASPKASAVLHQFKVVIKHDGQQQEAYLPLAH